MLNKLFTKINMTEYQILRWDPIIASDNGYQVPMITIVPDTYFMQFARANNFTLYCKFRGTGVNLYDGSLIKGIVNRSCDVPNCRPNFCSDTGTYVITLDFPWIKYPNYDSNGLVSFMGFKDLFSLQTPQTVGGLNQVDTCQQPAYP